MEFVKFNKHANGTLIEQLYESVEDTISICDKNGFVYHNCTIGWEQGRTRSAEFDNYRFYHKGYTIWPESVDGVAFEDADKKQFMKTYPEEDV
jgi:hypothetical protein